MVCLSFLDVLGTVPSLLRGIFTTLEHRLTDIQRLSIQMVEILVGIFSKNAPFAIETRNEPSFHGLGETVYQTFRLHYDTPGKEVCARFLLWNYYNINWIQ